jgi:hypothetical protein
MAKTASQELIVAKFTTTTSQTTWKVLPRTTTKHFVALILKMALFFLVLAKVNCYYNYKRKLLLYLEVKWEKNKTMIA